MIRLFRVTTQILAAISIAVAAPPSDSAAVEILQKIADRIEGIDHSATLTIEKYAGGELRATQSLSFHIRFPDADSITMQTMIELLPGSRGAGQKFWQWKFPGKREKQWLYTPASGKLREIARRRVGRLALFNIDDLAITEADILGLDHTVESRDPASGRIEIRSRVIGKSSRRVAGKRVAESRLWIDLEQNLVVKSQSFSAKGNLIQTIEVTATETAGGIVWATEVEITLARKNEVTRIKMTNLSVGKLTDDALFLPTQS